MSQTNTIDYTEFPGLKSNDEFELLMDQGIELAKSIKDLQEQYDTVREELDDLLTEKGIDNTVGYNGYRVAVIDRPAKPKLDKAKLLRLLGPKGPSLFKQAMIPGTASRYVQIVKDERKEASTNE